MTFLKSIFASTSILTIAACTMVGPDYQAPNIDPIAPVTFAPDDAFTSLAEDPAQEWWLAFDDPVLTGLIDRAHDANRDLAEAAANVQAARAFLRLEQVNRRPTGEVSASYEYQRPNLAGSGFDGIDVDGNDLITVGASAGWELDFFGRVARLTEAAASDLEATEWLRRDVEVLVAAETAAAYVDLRTADAGIDIATRNLDVQTETLDITKTRLEEGLGSRLDVTRAQAQVRATEATVPPFEAQRIAALNRLATLTGQTVGEIDTRVEDSDWKAAITFPNDLPVGDVEGLLRRRADVRAAESELAASTARIGVAVADYFPRVSLIGGVTASAANLSGFGSGNAIGYGVGPTLSWVGFDRGLVGAGVGVARAETDAALARYEQRVLVALEESQTAFAAYGRQRIRLAYLDQSVDLSRESAELARLRYDEGADEFLNVLDAEARMLEAEAIKLDSEQAAALGLIEIYRALGAGWRSELRS